MDWIPSLVPIESRLSCYPVKRAMFGSGCAGSGIGFVGPVGPVGRVPFIILLSGCFNKDSRKELVS